MTINKECVIKSLKSDYWDIGRVAAVCLIISGVIYTTHWCAYTYQTQVRDFFSMLTQPITAVNVFIVSEIIVMVLWGLVPLTMDDKQELKKSNTTRITMLLSTLTMLCVWIAYGATSAINSAINSMRSIPPPRYPDVLMILIILMAINAVIVCPVSVAIARCKE